MPFSHLRRRVDALKRKLAVPLAVVQLRPMAEEYCDQWATAVMSGEVPPPATPRDVRRPMPTAASARAATSGGAHALGPSEDSDAVGENEASSFLRSRVRETRPVPLTQRVASAGFRIDTFMKLSDYMNRCSDDRVLPHPNDILAYLLPRAAVFGLIPASPPLVSY